jgi:hypothetical protein
MLHDQGVIEVDAGALAVVFDSFRRVFAQKVKPDAVFVGIHLFQQIMSQPDHLGITDLAFEDGQLHALAEIFANTSHSPQASPPFWRDRRNVVGDEHIHGGLQVSKVAINTQRDGYLI